MLRECHCSSRFETLFKLGLQRERLSVRGKKVIDKEMQIEVGHRPRESKEWHSKREIQEVGKKRDFFLISLDGIYFNVNLFSC